MSKDNLGAGFVGLLVGLLSARLLALLFAARPDNPAISLLLTLTAPLTAPFRILDRLAGQPQFGARLELATLAALVLAIGVAAVVQWAILNRRHPDREDHHA
jgi:preprotein translocase subunit SecD